VDNPQVREKLRAYVELTKPRINFMVLVTTVIGYFLGAQGLHNISLLILTLLGTALSCAGSSVLNMYLERDLDALMKRTKRRPLASGLVSPQHVLGFGLALVLSGTVLLVWKVNLLTGFLALLTAFLYVLVYTPLKRLTWLNTLIGSIPGALPPMGGWAAASGDLGIGAWVIFLILFIWQQPHFYAIAWMYRDDYARAGLKMLPVIEPDGKSTFRQILLYSLALIPISMLPTMIGMSGWVYCAGAVLLGSYMLIPGIRLANSHSVGDARKLLHATIIYLPVLLILVVSDVGF
jgi:protoheme IX farnesyltransferase